MSPRCQPLAQVGQHTNKDLWRGFCSSSPRARAEKKDESQAQDRPVVAHMEIFEMELWDEAGSGGEETRMRKRGLTRNEW